MDLVIAIPVVIALLPVFLLIAIAIRIDDRGQALFRQERLGRKGKVFVVYKFRKFYSRTNNDGSILTTKNDQRYSRVGQFLERTKLNELPQLINVVRGEMSLVGPRPEVLDFSHCFNEGYSELLNFTPGLFGPSQCVFRNESAMYPEHGDMISFYEQVLFPRKAQIDIEYYRTATCEGDLYWICRSLIAVFCQPPIVDQKNVPSTFTHKDPAI